MKDFHIIVNFIRELYNQPNGFIPLHAPVFNGNEKKYLLECIDSTYVSSVGKFVNQFEVDTAKYTGAKKAVACVNGTNALHLALLLAGVERDTEVITQPLTFIATINAISYCGANPIFLDVDIDTLSLSPTALRTWLENNTSIQHAEEASHSVNRKTGRRISACVPMHTFGLPGRIDEIVSICNEYNIPVVEDAAESLGSFYKNKHTGTFGKVGVLSFNGNKIMTTGGGGMLLFMDEGLAIKAKHLTTQAKEPHPWEFNHDAIGYNYRMPNINAALGLAQLEQLPVFLESKRKIAKSYDIFFNDINIAKRFKYLTEPENSQSNYWLNSILLNSVEERDAFLKYSNANGVMTRPVWKLMNELEMFISFQTDDLKNSYELARRLVNIPSSALISNL